MLESKTTLFVGEQVESHCYLVSPKKFNLSEVAFLLKKSVGQWTLTKMSSESQGHWEKWEG